MMNYKQFLEYLEQEAEERGNYLDYTDAELNTMYQEYVDSFFED